MKLTYTLLAIFAVMTFAKAAPTSCTYACGGLSSRLTNVLQLTEPSNLTYILKATTNYFVAFNDVVRSFMVLYCDD